MLEQRSALLEGEREISAELRRKVEALSNQLERLWDLSRPLRMGSADATGNGGSSQAAEPTASQAGVGTEKGERMKSVKSALQDVADKAGAAPDEVSAEPEDGTLDSLRTRLREAGIETPASQEDAMPGPDEGAEPESQDTDGTTQIGILDSVRLKSDGTGESTEGKS
jgi:hypothetical protein